MSDTAERLLRDAADEIDRLRVKVETGLQRRKESTERIRVLEEALRDLVKINESHNEAMESVIGRPLDWKDNYLDAARRALEQTDD